jgi:TolA-binding protein
MKDYEQAIEAYRQIAETYPTGSQSPAMLMKAAEIAERRLGDKTWALGLYREVVQKYGSERIAEKAREKIDALSQIP